MPSALISAWVSRWNTRCGKQIAGLLVISRKTVDNHIEHIYTKIGVSNRARASLFAVRHGLVTPTADEDVSPLS